MANEFKLSYTAADIDTRLGKIDKLAEYAKTADLGALAKKDSLTAADVGALAADTLPTAINTALAQAKVSGEFDGTSVTVSKVTESTAENGSNIVTFSDGKTLTIKNGRTPVKGADFWTEADQESIVQQVLAVMGMHIVGVVNENNDIIFSGDLSAGTYNLKFEDVEGNVQEVGTIEIIKDDDDEPAYINWIPKSIDTDGSIYNDGLGYKNNYRISSTTGGETSQAGYACTGFIPVKANDIIYGSSGILNGNTGWVNLTFYDSSFTKITSFNMQTTIGSAIKNEDNSFSHSIVADPSYMTASQVKQVAYFRMGSEGLYDGNAIITVNQPIVDEKPAYTNMLPNAINADKTEFVGTNGEDGYKTGYRLNSSGVETAQGGMCVTGFIPVKMGDIVRLANLTMKGASSNTNYNYLYIYLYDSSFARITPNGYVTGNNNGWPASSENFVIGTDGNLSAFTINTSIFGGANTNVAYVRFSAQSITDATIVTVNQEIT